MISHIVFANWPKNNNKHIQVKLAFEHVEKRFSQLVIY